MGFPDRTFVMHETQSPPSLGEAIKAASVSTQKGATWENEHVHASLTAAGLIGLAVAAWLAGLHIAPLACVVFAVALLVADARARVGKRSPA